MPGQRLRQSDLKAVIEHPELQGLRRFILATADAHRLHEQFGFSRLRLGPAHLRIVTVMHSGTREKGMTYGEVAHAAASD